MDGSQQWALRQCVPLQDGVQLSTGACVATAPQGGPQHGRQLGGMGDETVACNATNGATYTT